MSLFGVTVNQVPAEQVFRSVRGEDVRSPLSQLDGGAQRQRRWTKFQTFRNPIEEEPGLTTMQPTDNVLAGAEAAYLRADTGIGKGKRISDEAAYKQALVAADAKSAYKRYNTRAKDQISSDFRNWLLARGSRDDVDRYDEFEKASDQELYGKGPLSRHKTVLDYIDSHVDARIAFERDLTILKARYEQFGSLLDASIEQCWMYYKFVVRGMQPTNEDIAHYVEAQTMSVSPLPGTPARVPGASPGPASPPRTPAKNAELLSAVGVLEASDDTAASPYLAGGPLTLGPAVDDAAAPSPASNAAPSPSPAAHGGPDDAARNAAIVGHPDAARRDELSGALNSTGLSAAERAAKEKELAHVEARLANAPIHTKEALAQAKRTHGGLLDILQGGAVNPADRSRYEARAAALADRIARADVHPSHAAVRTPAPTPQKNAAMNAAHAKVVSATAPSPEAIDLQTQLAAAPPGSPKHDNLLARYTKLIAAADGMNAPGLAKKAQLGGAKAQLSALMPAPASQPSPAASTPLSSPPATPARAAPMRRQYLAEMEKKLADDLGGRTANEAEDALVAEALAMMDRSDDTSLSYDEQVAAAAEGRRLDGLTGMFYRAEAGIDRLRRAIADAPSPSPPATPEKQMDRILADVAQDRADEDAVVPLSGTGDKASARRLATPGRNVQSQQRYLASMRVDLDAQLDGHTQQEAQNRLLGEARSLVDVHNDTSLPADAREAAAVKARVLGRKMDKLAHAVDEIARVEHAIADTPSLPATPDNMSLEDRADYYHARADRESGLGNLDAADAYLLKAEEAIDAISAQYENDGIDLPRVYALSVADPDAAVDAASELVAHHGTALEVAAVALSPPQRAAIPARSSQPAHAKLSERVAAAASALDTDLNASIDMFNKIVGAGGNGVAVDALGKKIDKAVAAHAEDMLLRGRSLLKAMLKHGPDAEHNTKLQLIAKAAAHSSSSLGAAWKSEVARLTRRAKLVGAAVRATGEMAGVYMAFASEKPSRVVAGYKEAQALKAAGRVAEADAALKAASPAIMSTRDRMMRRAGKIVDLIGTGTVTGTDAAKKLAAAVESLDVLPQAKARKNHTTARALLDNANRLDRAYSGRAPSTAADARGVVKAGPAVMTASLRRIYPDAASWYEAQSRALWLYDKIHALPPEKNVEGRIAQLRAHKGSVKWAEFEADLADEKTRVLKPVSAHDAELATAADLDSDDEDEDDDSGDGIPAMSEEEMARVARGAEEAGRSGRGARGMREEDVRKDVEFLFKGAPENAYRNSPVMIELMQLTNTAAHTKIPAGTALAPAKDALAVHKKALARSPGKNRDAALRDSMSALVFVATKYYGFKKNKH